MRARVADVLTGVFGTELEAGAAETVRTPSSCFGRAGKGGAGLVEIDDFAVEPELVKVTAGRFESARGIEAAGLQRVEPGNADQALDGSCCHVVIRGVEEDGSTWLAKGGSGQPVGGERPWTIWRTATAPFR